MLRKGMVIAGTILLAGTAAGCTGANTDITEGQDGKTPSTSSVHKEPAELVIFSSSGWTEDAFNDKFGNAIRKAFPQHTIKYLQRTKELGYAELLSSGQQIDLVWESVANFPAILQHNLQFDMTPLIKEQQVDISQLEPTMVEAMRIKSGGQLYALPVVTNTLSLYYNKDLFDKFGVSYPKDGMTWDDVLDFNRKLTREDGGAAYAGLALSTAHYFALNPLSLSRYDEKTGKQTLADSRWKTLLGVFASLSDVSVYRTSGVVPGVAQFVKEKNVAMLAALANIHTTQDVSGLNWDVVTYPVYKEAPQAHPQSYPTYFGISATSKHKAQVMDVIHYLISPSFQLDVSKSGTLPALQTEEIMQAFAKDTNFKDKNVKSALYKPFAPISVTTMYDGIVGKAYDKHLRSLISGQIDLNTLLRTAEEEAEKGIEEAKQTQVK